MRFQRLTVTLIVLLGIAGLTIGTLHAGLSASANDSTSEVRGALGISLDDLALNESFGFSWLLLNGGSALIFGGLAIVLGRLKSPKSKPLPSLVSRSRHPLPRTAPFH